MKRYLHTNSDDGPSTKKKKQLKLETLLLPKDKVSSDNEPGKNLGSTNSNFDTILPPAYESLTCSPPINAPSKDNNAEDMSKTKGSRRMTRPNEAQTNGTHTKLSCFDAELLSEVSFISAESLILLLERLSLIETQLQTIIRLVANREEAPCNLNKGRLYPFPNYSFPKEGCKAPLNQHEKVTRIYQAYQVVVQIPVPDLHLWNTKSKILTALSTLLDSTIAAKKLKQFHFLPHYKGFSRVLLSFVSSDIPRRIFQSAPHLMSYRVYPSRVFKEADPKPLIRNIRSFITKLKKTVGPSPSSKWVKDWGINQLPNDLNSNQLSLQNRLLALRNQVKELKSSDILATLDQVASSSEELLVSTSSYETTPKANAQSSDPAIKKPLNITNGVKVSYNPSQALPPSTPYEELIIFDDLAATNLPRQDTMRATRPETEYLLSNSTAAKAPPLHSLLPAL